MFVLKPLVPDQPFLEQYHLVFPEVTDPNGIFGLEAHWYGLYLNQTQLVGFCTVGQTSRKQVLVYNIGIFSQYQRQGLGHQLMNQLIQLYGRQDMYLFVHTENQIAQHLYQTHQFAIVCKQFVPPPNHVCMRRVGCKVKS